VGLDCGRLAAVAPALQRRLLRRAAAELGAEPDFAATESLLHLALDGRAGQRLQLAHSLAAERTPRELRLSISRGSILKSKSAEAQYAVVIPGHIEAPAFGLSLKIELAGIQPVNTSGSTAVLRNWRAGDRVRLRYTSGPRKVKEVLEHLRVTGTDRALWPVIELNGRLVWMQGVELEPEPGLTIVAQALA
jgi:tRNA(Ile)-lysidine synthase